MSLEKSICNFINKRKIKEEQIMLEINFTPENGLSKFLWVEVFPQVENVESLTKEASFSGKAFFEAVYLDADNKIQNYETSMPFLNKIIDENILPSSKIHLIPKVIEAQFDKNIDKIRAVIGFQPILYNIGEIDVLSGGDDDICIKSEDIKAQNLLKEECLTFNEDLEIDISEKMQNILGIYNKICVKDVVPNKDYFTISGEIHTTVKYLCEDEEIQRICSANYSDNFKREFEVTGLTADDIVEAFACVRKDTFKYELDKENKKILISVPIFTCYKAFEVIIISCASDIFSLKHNLEIITSSFSKSVLQKNEYLEEKIEGSTSIGEEEPRIDKIIGFSNANLNVTNVYYKDGEVVLEGIIEFCVVYFNDETTTINSAEKEIPFKVSLNIELPDDVKIFENTELTDLEIVARRGREIFLDAKIKSLLTFENTENDAVISNIEIKESLPEKNHAIEIYFGKKGDDIWDIAKELKVNPEIIFMQNPNLILPLEMNENIVIYNQKN